ncbi:MAG TPA: hypothetical protein VLV89_13235 [Candidatus Acidoferrum sp.]|nr:hypothetical protein [Candidatus Acidoferrum sp.]
MARQLTGPFPPTLPLELVQFLSRPVHRKRLAVGEYPKESYAGF